MKATEILERAAQHMRDRAATYDKPEGERSMAQTVAIFNQFHGTALTEAQGWHFLQVLKDVRLFARPGYHADSGEDCTAYSALKAEAMAIHQATTLAQWDKAQERPEDIRAIPSAGLPCCGNPNTCERPCFHGGEPTPAPDDDGWIAHDGGPCPVKQGEMVEVKHRNGGVYLGPALVELGIAEVNWRIGASWHPAPHDGDIIAYRLTTPN